MADMYTPDEIQEIFDRYNTAIRAGIPVSEALAREMADAVKGVKNYTATLNNSLKQLGQASKQAAQDIAKGASGASVFNNTIESAGNAAETVASQFGVLGKGIGLVINALTLFITAANKQSDALYSSFQQLSRTGSIGAGGMSEAFASMQKFGYSVEQLGDMTSLLAENSRALAQFGGTAFRGARQFADVANVLQRGELGEKFRNMGLSTDEINKNIAGFIKQQVGMGLSRAQMERNLSTETSKYIEQLVAVQRLTGQTREQLEEKEQQAQREQAFAYTQYELKQRAAAGDKQAEEEYQRNRVLSQVLEGKARDQFIAGIGGDIGAMSDLLRTAPETVEKMLTGGSLESVMNSLAREGKQAVDNLGPLARFNAFNDFLLPIDQLLKFQSQYGTEAFAKLLEDAKKNSQSTDAATKDQTKLLMSQLNTRQAFENLVNLGVEPVTRAMRILSGVVENLTSLLPGAPSKGYGQQGTGTKGGSLAATGAGAAAGAAAGSFLGPLGTAAGGIVGGLAGYAGYQLHGGAGATKEGLRIKSPESTAGGEASANLYALAQKIQKELGNDLIHFSAFNDSYHQGTNSVHTQGRALDFTIRDPSKAAQVAAMIRAMPGVSKVLDEYTNPSSRSTGGHIHAEINGFAGFKGRLSGPMSGYSPNVRMHGDEELSIRPAGGTINSNSSASEGTMVKLIERVDDLIYLSRSQLNVNEKMLKYAQ